MYKLIPATALAAALVLAAPAWAASAANDRSRAIEGIDHGTFTTTPIDDTHVLTADQAVGNAWHVGRYTLEASEVINFATLEVSQGAYTITSSSGALNGNYAGSAAGTSVPSVITYHVSGPVLGGSGRFAGTTGWLTFDGVANLSTGKLCDRVSGWISKPSRGIEHRSPSLVVATRGATACQL